MKIYPSTSIVTKVSKLYVGCKIKVKEKGMAGLVEGLKKFNGEYITLLYYFKDENGDKFINAVEFLPYMSTNKGDEGFYINRFELE